MHVPVEEDAVLARFHAHLQRLEVERTGGERGRSCQDGGHHRRASISSKPRTPRTS